MRDIAVIAHNIRSCHNIGSLMRTAEGLGVTIYMTGYTPYPKTKNDSRLPHVAERVHRQIHKTALGAELTANWQYIHSVKKVTGSLKKSGYSLIALEQHPNSTPLQNFTPKDKVALLLGEEVMGINHNLLSICDATIEIPMFGKKESFNVSQAASMALYHLRFS